MVRKAKLVPHLTSLELKERYRKSLVFKTFASEVGAGEKKVILIVQDRARWHRSQKVKLPQGIVVEFLPPYSPELQPAQRLWALVNEPLVNQHFETIEQLEMVLEKRCCLLNSMTDKIKKLTDYYWLNYT